MGILRHNLYTLSSKTPRHQLVCQTLHCSQAYSPASKTRCIHCFREEHTNENCPSHTRADTWCQCQWQPASIASLPHPINCSQATLPLHNLVACSTLMLASSAPMAKTGSLATHVSCVVAFTCPTWTSKSGKCQYPYSHQPFIKHAKDQ